MRRSAWIIPCFALVLSAASSGALAQTDLSAVKQAVSECVNQVRQDATRPENYQFGQPPMWKNFDAYLSPDGTVHNNTRLVGEQDGVFRFEKCLSARGFSLGTPGAVNVQKPADTCTQEELDQHPGDCWIKLSAWEKHLSLTGLMFGWLNGHQFGEVRQYLFTGDHLGTGLFPTFDEKKLMLNFDQLYTKGENRSIWWNDAFDLAFRAESNPSTKDIPALTLMYQKHERPLFSGYLRAFVSPNKVVISEFNDFPRPQGLRNKTSTITLLGVSDEGNTRTVDAFMAALLNIKHCNTLISEIDRYQFRTDLKTEADREKEKKLDQGFFSPLLRVVIVYPHQVDREYQQEEFFNDKMSYREFYC